MLLSVNRFVLCIFVNRPNEYDFFNTLMNVVTNYILLLVFSYFFLMLFVGCFSTTGEHSGKQNYLIHPDTKSQILVCKRELRIVKSNEEKIFPLRETDQVSQDNSSQIVLVPSRSRRIALDPGHIGGDNAMLEIEEKHMRLKDLSGKMLTFEEADLNLATALLLSDKLDSAGYHVFLTREEAGLTAFGKTYEAWLEEDFVHVIDSLYDHGTLSPNRYQFLRDNRDKPKVIFHAFFKNYELRQRQAVINNFNPNLTIVIHYNVHAAGRLESTDDYYYPTEENYHMAFVPGAFMAGELETDEAINDFIFLLHTDILKESIDLSSKILQELEKRTSVAPVGREFERRYPFTNCVFTGKKGVYARNLAMTRFTKAPICFIELLCQDNLQEARLLADTSVSIGPITSSPRVQAMADALYHGISRYCGTTIESN